MRHRDGACEPRSMNEVMSDADCPRCSLRIVVPFTKRMPEVEASLEEYGEAVEWVDVSEDLESYWRLLKRLWDDRETVVINEHDMVQGRPGQIREMYECPYAWCLVPYEVAGAQMAALGLAKFHRVLLRDRPDIVDPDDRHWAHQDVSIAQRLIASNIVPHLHLPAAVHLNPNKSIPIDRMMPDGERKRFLASVPIEEGAMRPSDFSMPREQWEGLLEEVRANPLPPKPLSRSQRALEKILARARSRQA